MPTYPSSSPLLHDAEALARRLLGEDSDRLAHSRYAAGIAELAADALSVPDPESLVAAAWLHDIGHAPHISRTGFHPLDGALHLAAEGWPDRTVLLVAHHAHAAILAPYFGVDHQLAVLDHVPGIAEDVLTYADMRSGPTGMGASPARRVSGLRGFQGGSASIPKAIHEERYRLLLAACDRIGNAINARPGSWSARRHPHVTGMSGARLGS
ncbi:MAG: HD domain-containing protein [Actinomycetes bacterium]